MTCDSILKVIPLYFYGELTPVEEDRVEEHFHACAACTQELERVRGLATALTGHQAEVPATVLEECRADLRAAIQGGAPVRCPAALRGGGQHGQVPGGQSLVGGGQRVPADPWRVWLRL